MARIHALKGTDHKHVVIDSDDPLPRFATAFESVRVHQANAEMVRRAGYHGASFVLTPKNVMAWEKALWLHKQGEFQASHVWIFEDDVLVPAPDTVQRIDAQYPSADLLTASHEPETEESTWHWWKTLEPVLVLGKPRFHSMGCARRVSARLLQAVHEWVREHGILDFHEILFNTLAHQAGMDIVTPRELASIVYRRDWKDEEVSSDMLVHPVKDMTQQERIWSRFKNAAVP